MKVLVSGLLAYDKIMDYPGQFSDHILPDKIHQINVSFVTEELSENFGGCAGNIAYTLSLLGVPSALLTAAGKDFLPYKTHLEKNGVDLKFVKIIPDKLTSVVTIMTDRRDNQIASVYLGTMGYPADFNERDISSESLAIISPGNVNDMQRLPEIYRNTGTPFIFDPGQQIPLLSSHDLKNGIHKSKALITNDYELSLIKDKTGWNEEDIIQETEFLVTTIGEKGSVIFTKGKKFEIPPVKTNSADPTGAGDAYRAGFIKGLISNWNVETIGRFASTVAAFAVEQYGTQNHVFTLEQVKSRYRENFREQIP